MKLLKHDRSFVGWFLACVVIGVFTNFLVWRSLLWTTIMVHYIYIYMYVYMCVWPDLVIVIVIVILILIFQKGSYTCTISKDILSLFNTDNSQSTNNLFVWQCQRLFSLLLLRLVYEPCQTSMTAPVVCSGLSWPLMKLYMAVNHHMAN